MLGEDEPAAGHEPRPADGQLPQLRRQLAGRAVEQTELVAEVDQDVGDDGHGRPPVAGAAGGRPRLGHRVPLTEEGVVDGQHLGRGRFA